MAIRLDNKTLQTVPVPGTIDKPSTFDVMIDVPTAGKHRLSVAYLNNYKDMVTTDPKLHGDRNLVVNSLAVEPVAGSHGIRAGRRFSSAANTGRAAG